MTTPAERRVADVYRWAVRPKTKLGWIVRVGLAGGGFVAAVLLCSGVFFLAQRLEGGLFKAGLEQAPDARLGADVSDRDAFLDGPIIDRID